jgi:hypothetical protein
MPAFFLEGFGCDEFNVERPWQRVNARDATIHSPPSLHSGQALRRRGGKLRREIQDAGVILMRRAFDFSSYVLSAQ